MIRACFADNADMPISCSIDIDEHYNCVYAQGGTSRDECKYWNPERAIALARDLLGGKDTSTLYKEIDVLTNRICNLLKLLDQHDHHWRAVADELGGICCGGVDGSTEDPHSTAGAIIVAIKKLRY